MPWWISSMYFIASSFVGMVAHKTNGGRRNRQGPGKRGGGKGKKKKGAVVMGTGIVLGGAAARRARDAVADRPGARRRRVARVGTASRAAPRARPRRPQRRRALACRADRRRRDGGAGHTPGDAWVDGLRRRARRDRGRAVGCAHAAGARGVERPGRGHGVHAHRLATESLALPLVALATRERAHLLVAAAFAPFVLGLCFYPLVLARFEPA